MITHRYLSSKPGKSGRRTMTIKKNPITASELSLLDVLSCLRYLKSGSELQDLFQDNFAKKANCSNGLLLNSGLSGFYLILESLKKNSYKKEVILPAYTAGSLIVAVRKAGLTPVLCDISLTDFNLDTEQLGTIVSENTLCIVGVHMFGLVISALGSLKSRFSEVNILEDACQSYGSLTNGTSVGAMGDVSFFSFNKGKNLPTFGGGAIATNDLLLGEQLKQTKEELVRSEFPTRETLQIMFKLISLCFAINPWIYGPFFSLIAKFKDTKPPEDVILRTYTEFQSGLANRLMKKSDKIAKKRFNNGKSIIDALDKVEGIRCPKIADKTMPAFNRLPILIKDLNKRESIEKKLWSIGYETSRMYEKPLHEMFELGYKNGDFPNAEYLADHLLTLPTHPLLTANDIEKIVAVITRLLIVR